jgi:DNA polymerase III subunit gamma/tau
MTQQLSLSARPKTLDQLFGQEKLVKSIRGHFAKGRDIKAWMFTGGKGTGKTTVSRILALSLQCDHQKVFGNPCKECRSNKAQFPIYEINAAIIGGKEDLKKAFEGSQYGVMGAGKRRVYIVDECHRMSAAAQSLCLGMTEDVSSDETMFILCTTDPHQVLDTLRSRCQVYELKPLDGDGILTYVDHLLKKAGATEAFPADRLADALIEKGVNSHRVVAQAVEKYLAGDDPEYAAMAEGVTDVDIRVLTKAISKGDWEGTRKALLAAQSFEARAVQAAMLAYLRAILMEHPNLDARGNAISKGIEMLVGVQQGSDLVVSCSVVSVAYRMCGLFDKYQL